MGSAGVNHNLVNFNFCFAVAEKVAVDYCSLTLPVGLYTPPASIFLAASVAAKFNASVDAIGLLQFLFMFLAPVASSYYY